MTSWITWISRCIFYWFAQLFSPVCILWRNSTNVHGGERDTLSEAVVSLKLWSRSRHGWFVEHSFLVQILFYNDVFVDILFRCWVCERKLSWLFASYKHICTKWSFAVSLLFLAHHAVRLWCSPRRWHHGATNPEQIHWNYSKSLLSFQGTWPSLTRGNC